VIALVTAIVVLGFVIGAVCGGVLLLLLTIKAMHK
jgi:uncharacterized membrane protein YoaK (UPF0700 family)